MSSLGAPEHLLVSLQAVIDRHGCRQATLDEHKSVARSAVSFSSILKYSKTLLKEADTPFQKIVTDTMKPSCHRNTIPGSRKP